MRCTRLNVPEKVTTKSCVKLCFMIIVVKTHFAHIQQNVDIN